MSRVNALIHPFPEVIVCGGDCMWRYWAITISRKADLPATVLFDPSSTLRLQFRCNTGCFIGKYQ